MAVNVQAPPQPGIMARPARWMSDEQLAQLAASGSDRAFAAIYDRYLPALVRYCRGILTSQEDAEDAAQATMMNALRALHERPLTVHLRPWLYRIAHNEAISLIRARRHHEHLDKAADVELPGPDEALAIRTRLTQLVSDLRDLPERQRSALVMRELCGLEYEEIADALGSSSGAAMQTVFDARSALSEYADARDESCVAIQRCISAGDRRRLRGRRVRAHLRGCQRCQSFQLALGTRRGDFALLAPLAGKGALLSLLGALGGGGGRALLGGGSASQGLKLAAVGAVVATAGGGLAVQMTQPPTHPRVHRAKIAAHAPRAVPLHHRAQPLTAPAVRLQLSGVGHHVRPSSSTKDVAPPAHHVTVKRTPTIAQAPAAAPVAAPAPAPAPTPTPVAQTAVQHPAAPAPAAMTPMQQWMQWMLDHGYSTSGPAAAASDNATTPNLVAQIIQQAGRIADPAALTQAITQQVSQLTRGTTSGCAQVHVGPLTVQVGPACPR